MTLAIAPIGVSNVDELPCRQYDPDLWFADSPVDLEVAKTLCGFCPLRVECLAVAVERGETWGVWGGEIIDHGTIVTQKRPRGRPRKDEVARDEALRLEVADRVSALVRRAA